MSETPAVPPRRHPLHSKITDDLIETLVHAFYADVRRTRSWGRSSTTRSAITWHEHLEKLCAFWSSVAMMTGRYKGTPMQKHMALQGISEEHFDRWLRLWRAKAHKLMYLAAVSLMRRSGSGPACSLDCCTGRTVLVPVVLDREPPRRDKRHTIARPDPHQKEKPVPPLDEKLEPVLAEVLHRNAGEDLFHQAVREVLDSLGAVIAKHPDYAKRP